MDAQTRAVFSLICSLFIFLMQLGFALLETGSSPRRHALNVFSKNVLDMLLNALWFWALGYAFGFGKDVGGVLGTSNFFLEDSSASLHWFEQWVFATNASTIFGGCIAGRAKFAAYMVIASVTSAWTYPVVAHWVWHADGWLATMGQNGVLDFSGSGVVHLTGGVIGLVACVMIGPRHGYFQDNQDNNQAYNSRRWGPHSMLMAMTGVGLLWVGWYGFNVAPAVLVSDEYFVLVSGRVVVATTLCPAAAAMTLFMWRRWKRMPYSLNDIANSSLAGLVSITAPCATVSPWAAVLIGVTAAAVYSSSARLLRRLEIDDPLEAAPVHLFGGALGVLAAGLFAKQDYVQQVSRTPDSDEYGLLLGGGIKQFGQQALCVFAIIVWVGVNTFLVIKVLQHLHLLRVDVNTEMGGLDISKHGVTAYPETPTYHDIPSRGVNGSPRTRNAINDQRFRDMMLQGNSGMLPNGAHPPKLQPNPDDSRRMNVELGAEFNSGSHSAPPTPNAATADRADFLDIPVTGSAIEISVGESAADEARRHGMA